MFVAVSAHTHTHTAFSRSRLVSRCCVRPLQMCACLCLNAHGSAPPLHCTCLYSAIRDLLIKQQPCTGAVVRDRGQ